jgi:hypothetical protein
MQKIVHGSQAAFRIEGCRYVLKAVKPVPLPNRRIERRESWAESVADGCRTLMWCKKYKMALFEVKDICPFVAIPRQENL